jgi:hypothetical protein
VLARVVSAGGGPLSAPVSCSSVLRVVARSASSVSIAVSCSVRVAICSRSCSACAVAVVFACGDQVQDRLVVHP